MNLEIVVCKVRKFHNNGHSKMHYITKVTAAVLGQSCHLSFCTYSRINIRLTHKLKRRIKYQCFTSVLHYWRHLVMILPRFTNMFT